MRIGLCLSGRTNAFGNGRVARGGADDMLASPGHDGELLRSLLDVASVDLLLDSARDAIVGLRRALPAVQ